MSSDRATSHSRRAFIWLARGATLGQVLFTAGWVVGGLLQDEAYSSARHDISDLGALTAQMPWVWLLPQGIAGVLTIAFALCALEPALRTTGHRAPISAWLVALSLMGLDNVSDVFFRLDCRAADAGCTPAVATASWPGTIHIVVGSFAGLATFAAPFALARRMRLIPEWRDLVVGALVFGVLFALLTPAYIALALNTGYGGYAQRACTVLISAGIILLARRVLTLARPSARHTSHATDGAVA